jgi:hypothetical protein
MLFAGKQHTFRGFLGGVPPGTIGATGSALLQMFLDSFEQRNILARANGLPGRSGG